MKATNILITVGAAIAAKKLVNKINSVELNDTLGKVGLARRRSHALQSLVLIGVGVAVGAGTALLCAPMTGRETRQRLGEGAAKLGQTAKKIIRENKDEAWRALANVAIDVSSQQRPQEYRGT